MDWFEDFILNAEDTAFNTMLKPYLKDYMKELLDKEKVFKKR